MIKFLDCTLRDGGFVNDWNFGYKTILSIFRRLNKANADIIEVGFLDERRITDLNRTINPKVSDFDKLFEKSKINQNTLVMAMIDFGTVHIDNVPNKSSTFLDGFRVIFKKKNIPEALLFCKQLCDKGYKVSVQPVSVTTYSDMEMLQLIEQVNQFNPMAMSIVDTYGLLHKNQLLRYFYLMEHNLNKDIMIGYHSHNNFQLAYANSIELVNKKISHDLMIDASLYGMGKSAGNLCSELITMYLNETQEKKYNTDQLLEAIDVDIMSIYKEIPWGYNHEYYMSALDKVHPSYVKFLRKKNSLPVKVINLILKEIPEKNKLSYDESLVQNLLEQHQKHFKTSKQNFKELAKIILNKKLLLLGPGSSLECEKEKINKFINSERPCVIAINFVPQMYQTDIIFICNNKRYDQLLTEFSEYSGKIVGTSNVNDEEKPFDLKIDFNEVVSNNPQIYDNSLIMCLNYLKKVKQKSLILAGFDGFSIKKENFYASYLNFVNGVSEPEKFNQAIHDEIEKLQKNIEIRFLTKSLYE